MPFAAAVVVVFVVLAVLAVVVDLLDLVVLVLLDLPVVAIVFWAKDLIHALQLPTDL